MKLVKLIYDIDDQQAHAAQEILDEVKALETSLAVRQMINVPNGRRVTREELEALCSASNVVMFPAVA